jgi:hypothetical protein
MDAVLPTGHLENAAPANAAPAATPSNKWLWIGLVVVIVILGIVLGVYFGTRPKPQPPPPPPPPVQAVEPVKPQTAVEPLGDFKSFQQSQLYSPITAAKPKEAIVDVKVNYSKEELAQMDAKKAEMGGPDKEKIVALQKIINDPSTPPLVREKSRAQLAVFTGGPDVPFVESRALVSPTMYGTQMMEPTYAMKGYPQMMEATPATKLGFTGKDPMKEDAMKAQQQVVSKVFGR